MNQQTKDYVRSLLLIIKTLYGENHTLKAMLQTCSVQSVRETWEKSLAQSLSLPDIQQELDSRFDQPFQKILLALDNQEALASLLKMPTKGLPI